MIINRMAVGLAMSIVLSMADALAAGKVIIWGLGTLEPRARKARTIHNPRTMAPVDVPARIVIFFKPGQELKKALNRKGETGENV